MVQTDQNKQKDNPQDDLGERIDHFRVRSQSLNHWLAVTLGILLILDASVFGMIHTFNALNAIQSHGRAVILARFTDPLFALCLVLPLGIILIIIAAINWQNGLTLYKNGFILRKHNQENIWSWQSVSRFDNQVTFVRFSGNTIAEQRVIVLEDFEHHCLKIHNNYERMDELTDYLRESILPELFTRSRSQVMQDKELEFNSHLTAFKEGLQVNETLIPWREIQISINKKGIVKINRSTDQEIMFKTKVRQIRNLDVLIFLAENPPVR